jgi:hypothetical protein
MSADLFPIAHRVWAEPHGAQGITSRRSPKQTPPEAILVFDTETLVDHTQALTFGAYRYYGMSEGVMVLREEGLFHADDLCRSDPHGLAILQGYAASHGADTPRPRALEVRTRSEFVERVFFRAAYGGRARVVGFNLPFDLSRLALDVAEARGVNHGGFSLILGGGKAEDGYKERRHRQGFSYDT